MKYLKKQHSGQPCRGNPAGDEPGEVASPLRCGHSGTQKLTPEDTILNWLSLFLSSRHTPLQHMELPHCLRQMFNAYYIR